jgi:hypothetical protein
MVEQMAGCPAELVSKLSASGARHLPGRWDHESAIFAQAHTPSDHQSSAVLIGEGIPLFGSVPRDIRLRHIATRT